MEIETEVYLSDEETDSETTDTEDLEYKEDNPETVILEQGIATDHKKNLTNEEKVGAKGENVYFKNFEEEFSSLRDVKLKPCEKDNTRLHKCGVCGKCFQRRSHLKNHALTHTGLKPFKCELCGKDFSRKGNVTKHLKRIHSRERTQSPPDPLNPKRRIRDPNRLKPFKCDLCDKSFTRGDSLRYHLRIHMGEMPYTCGVCGKSFIESGRLQKHVWLHSELKPFKCQFCEKGFKESGTLQKHLRIHTGYKPFECRFCDKTFTESGNLQRHLRTHTGDRPFKCEVCGKAFTQNGSLKIHRKTHLKDKCEQNSTKSLCTL